MPETPDNPTARPQPDTRSARKGPRRSIWFHLHFWIGWIAAIPISLVCLTGGVLAFDKYLRQWQYPERYQLEPADDSLNIDQVMAVYREAQPRLVVHHLGLPQSPRHAYSAYVSIFDDAGQRTGGGSVIVNPYTGELNQMADKVTVSSVMIDLHRHLAAGKTGQQVVGISSVVLAVTGVIGIVLWWPMRRRTLKRVRTRGNALDWHNLLGLVALLPLIVMALTGITFTWNQSVFGFLGIFQSAPVKAPDPVVEAPEDTQKVPLSVPLANLREAFPEGSVTGVQPGGGASAPYKWFVKQDGTDYTVFMNPYTGEEILRTDGKGGGAVSWYRRHFGKVHTMSYHPALAAAWGILSALGAVLAVTGIWISLKRWRRRAIKVA